MLRLEQAFEDAPGHGRLRFRLHNLGPHPVAPERLCYASMTRLAADVAVEGGRLLRRFGSLGEIAAPDGLTIPPGGVWEVVLAGLTHAPTNRTQGAMAAWVETARGPIAADTGDLRPPRPTEPAAAARLPTPSSASAMPGSDSPPIAPARAPDRTGPTAPAREETPSASAEGSPRAEAPDAPPPDEPPSAAAEEPARARASPATARADEAVATRPPPSATGPGTMEARPPTGQAASDTPGDRPSPRAASDGFEAPSTPSAQAAMGGRGPEAGPPPHPPAPALAPDAAVPQAAASSRGGVPAAAFAAAAPPLGLLPWPAEVSVGALGPAALLHPAPDADPAPFAAVAALHRRLFPVAPGPLGLDPVPGGRAVRTARDGSIAPGGYALDLSDPIVLAHPDPDGLRHGLVALAQMAHAARTDPRFAVPGSGRIADRPRHAWRGTHLDVARNFHPAGTVARLIDVLAWHRMNRLHLHATDDEGWRLPSAAFPRLTEIGAVRGRGLPLPPQYADGPGGQAGHYTAGDIRALVAQGEALGVTLVPEIDVPGHSTALLAALPELRDPGEPPDSYRALQSYPNNALNPGLERTYAVLETILGEVADLFPSAVLHLGGDEVPPGAWSASPAAAALAAREGLSGAPALQSHFMRRVQGIVRGLGRTMGGWDECAGGGGVEPEGALLFAWQSAGVTAALIAAGHDVIATPGEAYYLDMADRPGWDAAGTSWAGAVAAEDTYRFEVGAPEGPGRLLGVQACLWAEHLVSTRRLDAAAFPRLSAVAEAAWTPPGAKSWPRFETLAPLMPRL